MEQKRAVFFKFVDIVHDENFPQDLTAKVIRGKKEVLLSQKCIVIMVLVLLNLPPMFAANDPTYL